MHAVFLTGLFDSDGGCRLLSGGLPPTGGPIDLPSSFGPGTPGVDRAGPISNEHGVGRGRSDSPAVGHAEMTVLGTTADRESEAVTKGKRTFQPNNRRRARTHGFRLRMRTRAGRVIIAGRRRKSRTRLSA